MSRRYECRNKPLVELVHRFKVHIVGLPHVLIHQVKGCVSNELVQVAVVVLKNRKCKRKTQKVQLQRHRLVR